MNSAKNCCPRGFFSIGWEVADPPIIGDDSDRIKEFFAADLPGAKPRAVASWAGPCAGSHSTWR
ncbi:hypothetical protein [Kocuria marina]|uniref:hypothetical protein n=1 Tax=Kocuria marina TaxID=223184 RepID=UPI00155ACEC8|nr:hypothetical protein [Kocuria marina]